MVSCWPSLGSYDKNNLKKQFEQCVWTQKNSLGNVLKNKLTKQFGQWRTKQWVNKWKIWSICCFDHRDTVPGITALGRLSSAKQPLLLVLCRLTDSPPMTLIITFLSAKGKNAYKTGFHEGMGKSLWLAQDGTNSQEWDMEAHGEAHLWTAPFQNHSAGMSL